MSLNWMAQKWRRPMPVKEMEVSAMSFNINSVLLKVIQNSGNSLIEFSVTVGVIFF